MLLPVGRVPLAAMEDLNVRILLGTLLSILLAVSVALAADPKTNPQQERMKTCNAEAGEKKLAGDERKAFMSTCLKGQGAAPMTQQEKMKVCNKEAGAKALKGDDRKKFMSECLSSDKKS